MLKLVSLLVALSVLCVASARDDGLRKPPMGWMSWEKFGCQKDCVAHPDTCISAALFQQQAAKLVSLGFKDAGYDRLDVDDCYMDRRCANASEVGCARAGDLRADENRFPGGVPALSTKIHGMGLKFGVYNDVGPGTCAGNPGLNVSIDGASDAQLKRDTQLMANEWKVRGRPPLLLAVLPLLLLTPSPSSD